MERWRGRVAVVTGASAGIGAAIAYQLQDAGMDVVALARRSEKIPEAVDLARKDAEGRGRVQAQAEGKGRGKLHCLKCDVTSEEDILAAFSWVKANTAGVDVLVNNAGCTGNTGLTETNTAEWKRILDLNVLGLSICTREAIQQMKARGVDDGHIVHISSIAAHVNPFVPQFSMYFASKHAVRVLTEGLRKELVAAKSKIRVTEISPGLVKSDITKDLILDQAMIWSRPHLQPEDVADTVVYALGVPPHVQIHEVILRPLGEGE
ncbi:hypothetical protein R5R35_009511 [Gryllus longicercus]|uniref:Farnesol dehydrogenase n=1 Tax=Gryllus longicercus TaxID=2509291 RepID=A0AAN9VVU7_9ORTH